MDDFKFDYGFIEINCTNVSFSSYISYMQYLFDINIME